MKVLRWVFAVMILGVFSVAAQGDAIQYTDETVTFNYTADMFSEVSASVIESVPVDDQMPLWAANPAYVEYTFTNYAGFEDEAAFFHTPRLMFFNTGEFETYTDRNPDFPWGYNIEAEKLQALLAEEDIDWSQYTISDTNSNPDLTLPFLPLFNAAQVFRAQPEVLEFEGGKGIRYLSYYSQAVNPITDQEIFYTFQGITDNGSVYVAAIFPVQTGIFPAEVDFENLDYDAFAADYITYLEEMNTLLNEQSPDLFNPTLGQLDALIESIQLAGN